MHLSVWKSFIFCSQTDTPKRASRPAANASAIVARPTYSQQVATGTAMGQGNRSRQPPALQLVARHRGLQRDLGRHQALAKLAGSPGQCLNDEDKSSNKSAFSSVYVPELSLVILMLISSRAWHLGKFSNAFIKLQNCAAAGPMCFLCGIYDVCRHKGK